MKKGDKVRFLSEIGGGVIAGFQGNNIVLVEDEDGFQVPTPITDVVVVDQDDYSMSKMISEKMAKREKAEAHSNTELRDDSRSIKSLIREGQDEVGVDDDTFSGSDDPSDKEITFQHQAEERMGGNKLSCYLAFVAKNIKEITNTKFDSYIINDSNYYIQYTYLCSEGNAWMMKAQGEIEPNTKLFIEEFGRDDLNELGKVAIQLISYKKDKPFLMKPAVDVQFRLDPMKFFKLHAFVENDFFDDNAMLYTIVENDEVARPLVVDSKQLKEQMYKDEVVVENHKNKKLAKDDDTIVVDLHANEILETTSGMNTADILHYQLDYFRKVMKENNKKGKKIIFIHGKGEGVLRQAIIHELNYRYKSCQYQDASFQEYGYGATQVIVK